MKNPLSEKTPWDVPAGYTLRKIEEAKYKRLVFNCDLDGMTVTPPHPLAEPYDRDFDKGEEVKGYLEPDEFGGVTLVATFGRVVGLFKENISEVLPMTFEALSSWGSLIAETETGNIIEKRLSPPSRKDCTTKEEYRQLCKTHKVLSKAERFDVEEWRRTYPGEELNTQCDILDLGIFYDGGKYEPPVKEWREQFKANRNKPTT